MYLRQECYDRHPKERETSNVARSQQEDDMYAIASQGRHIQRVSESWASAICFHEAPVGAQIMLIEKI
jgi:hypothetical protein